MPARVDPVNDTTSIPGCDDKIEPTPTPSPLINGDGVGVGSILSSHPGIDVVSFTGSTRAGILISKAAADTVKNVSLELGGKSPNLVFDDCDLEKAVRPNRFFQIAIIKN